MPNPAGLRELPQDLHEQLQPYLPIMAEFGREAKRSCFFLHVAELELIRQHHNDLAPETWLLGLALSARAHRNLILQDGLEIEHDTASNTGHLRLEITRAELIATMLTAACLDASKWLPTQACPYSKNELLAAFLARPDVIEQAFDGPFTQLSDVPT